MEKENYKIISPEEAFKHIDMDWKYNDMKNPIKQVKQSYYMGEFKGWKIGDKFYPVVKCECSDYKS